MNTERKRTPSHSLAGSKRASDLVLAARAGDESAFAQLVRIYQNKAVAYAASVLTDYQLGEDAAQEAFVDVYRELKSLREPGAFEAWLRAIIFKHCDRITRRKQFWAEVLDAGRETPSASPSLDQQLQSQDSAASLWEGIEKLQPTERTVVLLYYMGEHSQSSVATFLGITENTVKTRLYSARRRLKRFLTARMEESFRTARPSGDPQFLRRVMSAVMRLQLYYLDCRNRKCASGSTIGFRRPLIPDSAIWLVEPRQPLTAKDWTSLLGLLVDNKIPGLAGAGQITDALLRQISRCRHLKYLDLAHSEAVTDEGLRHLAGLPHLEHLILNGTRITDAGLSVLRDLPRLVTLELCHQQYVTDEGLQHISRCERLERLNLMGTRTGDRAIRVLSGKPNLRHLFAGTCTTDNGLAELRQIPLFAADVHLPDAEVSLTDFEYHPTYLWLNLNAPFTDEGLKHVAKLVGVSGLNLFATSGHGPFDDTGSKVTPAGLSHIAGLPRLAWLGCCARLCNDEAMRHFASMPGLRFLMCQDALAGDIGFAALSRSRTLEYIWGRRCYNLTGRGFGVFQEMPALRGLAVSCRNVDDQGLATLPSIHQLREFMPIDVADSGFRHIGLCRQIEALNCMYCPNTTDAATRQISSLQLKSYQAWGTQITDESLGILGEMNSLEHVRLYRCANVTDAGVARLAGLPQLQKLDLEQLSRISPDISVAFHSQVSVNYAP